MSETFKRSLGTFDAEDGTVEVVQYIQTAPLCKKPDEDGKCHVDMVKFMKTCKQSGEVTTPFRMTLKNFQDEFLTIKVR